MGIQEYLRAELAVAADPERAAGQQRYMKSELPFYGVRVPEVRRIAKRVAEEFPVQTRAELVAQLRQLWDFAERREERYAVLGVLRQPRNAPWARDVANLPLFRYFAITGAWWDLVDELAAHVVGPILAAHPQARPVIWQWATDENLWVRRVAMLAQLTFRDRTDTELLRHAIDGSVADPDFFARKAIGWALRAYAGASDEAADWVRATVADLGDRLAPLAKREALKHLG